MHSFGFERSRMNIVKTMAFIGLHLHIDIWLTFSWHIFPSHGALAGQHILFLIRQIRRVSMECHGIHSAAQSSSIMNRQVTSQKRRNNVIRTVSIVHMKTTLPKIIRLKLSFQTRIGPLAHRCCVSSSSRQVKRCQPTRKERRNSKVRHGVEHSCYHRVYNLNVFLA